MTGPPLYLAFRSQGARYAVPIDRVREASRPRRIAPLPGAPPDYAGVTLVRGELLGVVDVGRSLGGGAASPETVPWQENALIVLEGQARALLVDRIDGVEEIESDRILPPGAARRLSGIVPEGERFLSILDLDTFFGEGPP